MANLTDYTIKECDYHFGVKFRIYPTKQQKAIIHYNSTVSRYMYNKILETDTKIYELKQYVESNKQQQLFAKQPHTTHIYNNSYETHENVKHSIGRYHETHQTTNVLSNFKPYTNELKYLKDVQKIRNMASLIGDTYADDSLTKNHPYLDSNIISYANRNYQQAWQNYHNGIQKKPTFHSIKSNPYSDNYQTYYNPTTMNIFVDDTHIMLPKLCKKHQYIKCDPLRDLLRIDKRNDFTVGTITVNKDNNNRYWVSLQLGSKTPFVEPLPKTGNMIGIDLNLDNYYTDSNGKVIPNPRFFRTQEERLSRMLRILSRRFEVAKRQKRSLKDASNYQKMRLKVAKLSLKIANQRNTFLHNLTTKIIKENDIIVTEELRSSNMLRNSKLAKSISDAGWRTFIGMLQYKAELYGRTMITVDARLTTQTCSECGYVLHKDDDASKNERLDLGKRQWTCPKCKVHHIRDHNAAKNILKKGLNKLQNP